MAASQSNLALFYLLLAKDLHINIKLDQMDELSFSIKNIEFPLLDIWMKSYNAASIIRINNKNSYFPLVDLTQLIAGDRSSLMTWKQYRTLASLSQKGPKAKWYTQLERSVLVSPESRYLLPEYRRITNKSFNDCKRSYVIELYREVLFDHIWNCYYVKDKDTFTVVWPKDTLVMFQLNVTFLNANRTPYWTIHSSLWFNGYNQNSFNDNISVIDGVYRHPLSFTIPRHEPMDYDKVHLMEIKDELSSFEKLFFYTDGSVQNGVPSHLKQRLDDCLDHHSMVINQGAAFVKTRVKIHTDNNCSISTITRFLRSRSKFCSRGFNNSLILIFIGMLIRDRNLDLELIKVKAHAGDPWNELVDELAKKGTEITIHYRLTFNFGSQDY
ncbi:hypothetical protein RCL_jg21783.t1 [Rhizophagus clarus]|uniref:RNase H type-1 domain-containing protein n=1 Tax=Rhizophagus clarus TaxID=94130 RepID=A0A8H3L2D2_9GLOM|nr:hypothetical protein RCL_jg21783.t1 [Rhizophagus clarus]